MFLVGAITYQSKCVFAYVRGCQICMSPTLEIDVRIEAYDSAATLNMAQG